MPGLREGGQVSLFVARGVLRENRGRRRMGDMVFAHRSRDGRYHLRSDVREATRFNKERLLSPELQKVLAELPVDWEGREVDA